MSQTVGGAAGPRGTLRLRWRRLVWADLAELVALHTDPTVMRWIGDPEPPEQVASALRRWSSPDDERFGVWAADTVDGRFVGWFSLDRRQSGIGVLGYRLHHCEWGQGLATEGCAAVLDWAFAGAGLHVVVAETYEYNTGSRRVMEKLGMRLFRRFRLDAAALAGDPEWEGDEVAYEVVAEQWRERTGAGDAEGGC